MSYFKVQYCSDVLSYIANKPQSIYNYNSHQTFVDVTYQCSDVSSYIANKPQSIYNYNKLQKESEGNFDIIFNPYSFIFRKDL